MRFRILCIVFLFLAAGCSQGSRASSCEEFAFEVDDLLARDAPAAELEAFIENSQEQVAKLISADPDRAEPCVTAVMEAMFTVGFAELEDAFFAE